MPKRKKCVFKKGADMQSYEDSLGSYTGVNTDDVYEKPVQEADDL